MTLSALGKHDILVFPQEVLLKNVEDCNNYLILACGSII